MVWRSLLSQTWEEVAEVVFDRIRSVGLTRGREVRMVQELGSTLLPPVLPGNIPGRAKMWPVPAGW